MSEPTARRIVRVVNPQGLHARPADLFVRRAQQFDSEVRVFNGDKQADGKSICYILSLVAHQDTELAIEAVGPDADDAADALAKLVESGFPEDKASGSKHEDSAS